MAFLFQPFSIFILRATPSAAGHFWPLGVAIWGAWCLHFGTPGVKDHFGTSGALWGTILAPRDRPGGAWERQDGQEVVWNRIFIDLEVILGPVYISFLNSRIEARNSFCRARSQVTF